MPKYDIPSGMIQVFDTACPDGWTRFSDLDNRFPVGAATYGGTGGTSGTHRHSANPPANGTSGHRDVTYNNGNANTWEPVGGILLTGYHTHAFNFGAAYTSYDTCLPQHIRVVYCQKD